MSKIRNFSIQEELGRIFLDVFIFCCCLPQKLPQPALHPLASRRANWLTTNGKPGRDKGHYRYSLFYPDIIIILGGEKFKNPSQ